MVSAGTCSDFYSYFYIVLEICGTTKMFIEKQVCPDQEALFNVFGNFVLKRLFLIAKKNFLLNRTVWFSPKENCARDSLNRNYYSGSVPSFTLKAADRNLRTGSMELQKIGVGKDLKDHLVTISCNK